MFRIYLMDIIESQRMEFFEHRCYIALYKQCVPCVSESFRYILIDSSKLV